MQGGMVCTTYLIIWRVTKSITVGKTRPLHDGISDEDLGIETLTSDFVNLLVKIFADAAKPPTLLVKFD
jgi:hypothetical protein